MKNKGFTLVELLAVILILIALAALITPKVFKQLKTAGNITEQEQINSLINISKIYINQHPSLLPQENNISSITIEELKQSELIKSKEIINPNTNEELKGCIVIKEENKKYKYEYKDNCTITVTFDANGGSVSKNNKEVIYGKTYDALPTPTREGYTFKGWNGKNLFDKESVPIENLKYIKGDGTMGGSTEYAIMQTNIKANTKYTIINSGAYKTPGYAIYDSNNNRLAGENYNYNKMVSFTTPSNALYIKFSVIVLTTSNVYDANYFQLEEGDTATSYEPYYITNDVKVTQPNDHTLKAIWEANS